MFLVTLILSFKYNYLYLLKFYFQQKKINKNPDNIYIPETTLNLNDLSTTENNKKGSTQKPVYAEKSTATIRISPRTEIANNNIDATVPIIRNNQLNTDAINKTEELNTTVPVNKNYDITATVPVNKTSNEAVISLTKNKTIDTKNDEISIENKSDNSEFKTIENILVINSDLDTINKIGNFI